MIRWSVFDMPTQAPVPPGYNWQRFSAAAGTPFRPPVGQEQLSESNLQQYQSTQSGVVQHGGESTWQEQQGFGFQPSYYEQTASNPLDHSTAIQRFSSIGQVHGHYDDPWQHMFALSEPEGQIGMGAPHEDIMQGQLGQGVQGMGMGESRRYPQTGYGADFGQYNTMNPTNEGYGAQFGSGDRSRDGSGSSGQGQEQGRRGYEDIGSGGGVRHFF